MNKGLVALSTVAILGLSANAGSVETQIQELKAQLLKLEKKVESTDKKVNKVRANTAGDNIKWSMEFRNTLEQLDYKNNKTGETAGNNSLLTSRLFLNMAAAPTKNLMFKGKLAIYSTWGAHLVDDSSDAGFKDWSASSKPSDTIMRIKEAYFVYKNKWGEQPIAFSIGRRPSSNGFLANYRENEDRPASPLAHITNMEVNAAMVKLDWGRFVEGAYTKFVYGRAHTGDNTGVYGLESIDINSTKGLPYATDGKNNGDDLDVDFFVVPGQAYNDGTYQIMYQWAHIFNTKGQKFGQPATKKAAAGTADLFSLGMVMDGLSEDNEFLENSKVFASVAYTKYDAKDGYELFGKGDGGSSSGNSIWVGAVVPDMITDNGKIGIEYNKGSKYWTPMTWAEDTAIGSKVAVRGHAYEAYWNFDLFGNKHLPSQVRYTRVQHDYTPNLKCAGWVVPVATDITADNIRFAITYKY